METFISDIQKMSTEDGPGIRTTVFFKGCNLKCIWCHNPENIPFYRQKYWLKDRCIGCFTCRDVCPNGAISFHEDGLVFDEKLCVFCLVCADSCPANAIEVKGQSISVQELIKELLKDKAYYEVSGGGVTLSGGEPVLHWEYIEPLVQELKRQGVHVALDTAGNYPYHILQKLLPYIDLVLYDIKAVDSEKHKEMTGLENTQILQNAKRLGAQSSVEVWIRTPIIPGYTDESKNIEAIGKFLKQNMPDITKWEMLSFNNLCAHKYRLLGKEWALKDAEFISRSKMEQLCKTARKYVKSAIWSGATKAEV